MKAGGGKGPPLRGFGFRDLFLCYKACAPTGLGFSRVGWGCQALALLAGFFLGVGLAGKEAVCGDLCTYILPFPTP